MINTDEHEEIAFPVITLITDFGMRDPYAAVMKGVIRARCPKARIEDLSHEIAPQDILEGALFLAAAAPFWPSGTIHTAVIDPGVGTERRPLAAQAGGQVFVLPDNGLLTLFLEEYPLECAYVIENPEFVLPVTSATFHGRDVFAPAAAQLASGARLEEAGPPAGDLCLLSVPKPVCEAELVHGEVIHVDRFGNAVTNISRKMLDGGISYRVQVSAITLSCIHGTYAAVQMGEPLALFGGTGLLEIATRNGSACDTLHLGIGAPVTLYTP